MVSTKSYVSKKRYFFKYGIFEKNSKNGNFEITVFLASSVHKRLQETSQSSSRTKYGQFHDAKAHHLESIGFEDNLERICLPLKKIYDSVKLSVDGDMSFAKILRDKQKECSDYLGIELNFDIAHLEKNVVKNVTAILKDHSYSGDAEGKIGNQNKLRLCTYIKTLMVKVAKAFAEIEDKEKAKQAAINEVNVVKNHCLGIHDKCHDDGENCSQMPVLRAYGDKFTSKQLEKLVEAIFDNWLLSTNTLSKLENAGSTSNLESFHSIFTNRNLWTKTGSLHVATPKFDGIVAVASTYYNFGDKETAKKVMSLGNWNILEGNLNSLDKAEIQRDSRVAYKMKSKAATKQARLRKQKQHQPTSKYRKLHPYIPSSKAAKKLAGTVRVSRKK